MQLAQKVAEKNHILNFKFLVQFLFPRFHKYVRFSLFCLSGITWLNEPKLYNKIGSVENRWFGIANSEKLSANFYQSSLVFFVPFWLKLIGETSVKMRKPFPLVRFGWGVNEIFVHIESGYFLQSKFLQALAFLSSVQTFFPTSWCHFNINSIIDFSHAEVTPREKIAVHLNAWNFLRAHRF